MKFPNTIRHERIQPLWLAIVPAMVVLVQVVAKLFGFEIDLGEIGNNLIDVVNAVFVVLAILGIVNAPTTKGMKDSEQAMTYTKPKQ